MTVVFLDTETTGVHRGYRAWEIAMIRRERSGAEESINIFIDIADIDLEHADPEGLAIGRFEQRHPAYGWPLQPGHLHIRASEAARLVQRWTDSALVFGVNASYDTVALDGLLAREGLESLWYYVPQDIAGIAYGYLLNNDPNPPRHSEKLSVACNVSPPGEAERHTAMGDARWVRRWYDQLHPCGLVNIA